MRFGPLFSTLLSHLLLVLFCSSWHWKPAVSESTWLVPAPSLEHLTQVCELSGAVEEAHPFVHIAAHQQDLPGLSDWLQGGVDSSPPFPLSAARLELSGESEREPSTRNADPSCVEQALRFPVASRARPPTRRDSDGVARHQIPVTIADPAQTAGPRPPPVQHRHT
jgi:hypothetical protein